MLYINNVLCGLSEGDLLGQDVVFFAHHNITNLFRGMDTCFNYIFSKNLLLFSYIKF